MTIALRVAIYARHSTAFQNSESSNDQVRACRPLVSNIGGEIARVFMDPEMSGYRRDRPGLTELLRLAREGEIDVVVCEALDRIARDGEDVAWLGKKLRYDRVRLHTISEGEICDMKLAIASMMGAIFLENLRKKTLRGMESAVIAGRLAGGRVFGYCRLKKTGADGQPINGLLEVDPDKAPIVVRILEEFAAGKSAYTIARDLNQDGVPGPTGHKWNQSTIRGDPKKHVGILHNPLYRGTLIWGRREWRRDPDSDKRERRYRMRDKKEWTVTQVPDLKIVSGELAERVDAEVARRSRPNSGPNAATAKRRKHLFSGLIKCGQCGANYVINGKDYYRCAANREGACDNRPSIRKSVIEKAILSVLENRLLTTELAELFASEFTAEVQRLQSGGDQEAHRLNKKLAELDAEIENIAGNFAKGVVSNTLVRMLAERETERERVAVRLEASKRTKIADILPHPVLLSRYEDEVRKAKIALTEPELLEEAARTLTSLLKSVTIYPSDVGSVAEIVGNPKSIVDLCYRTSRSSGSSLAVVAGVGFEPTTFRL